MFSEINAEFLKQWKEFPGTNTLKYSFVIIGLLCWLEYFIPDLKFSGGNFIVFPSFNTMSHLPTLK